MLDMEAQKDLDVRLSRIGGQLDGVRRMVQDPRLCIDILQQVAAIEAALKAVSDQIIQFHVEHCFVESMKKDDPALEKHTRELLDIVMRYLGR